MKISFINQIADLCERVGGDVQEVADAIGRDRRIGEKFLHPGPGYGGSCFPKDVLALIQTARDSDVPLGLVEELHQFNENRKVAMAKRVIDAAGGNVNGKSIAILGVTFKPNTDDMRDAPSLTILPILREAGAQLNVCDPQGRRYGTALLADVAWHDTPLKTAEDADLLLILTEWNEFRSIDLTALKSAMRGNVVVDTRNIFIPTEMAAAGFNYLGIGRTKN